MSGDAEAYGISLVLSSFSGVASIILLSEVLDLLPKLAATRKGRLQTLAGYL